MPGKDTGSEPEQAVTGFFGKLPGRGDFIGRHLPKSFLEPWDGWLQEAIIQSRGQLGGLWRDYYCTSPIWRFALGPGVCGPTAYAGILMPSVDRVGRYYPLVIAAPLPPDCDLLVLPTTAMAWYQQAEQLALVGLDRDRLDVDAFSREVKALGTPPIAPFSNGDGDAERDAERDSDGDGDGDREEIGNQAWYYPLPDPLKPAWRPPILTSELLRCGFIRHSLWWSEGGERISRCLLICDRLPPASGFAALLGGDWQQQGWIEKQYAVPVDCPGQSLTTGESSENS